MKKQFLFFLISLFVLCVSGYSQTAPVSRDSIHVSEMQQKKISLQFSETLPVDNLLVIVSNDKGETVFLENKYRFTGNYSRVINLQQITPGEYSLKIVRDKAVFTKKIIVP